MASPIDKPITGIPDPTKFGDPGSLPLGQTLPFTIQRHEARRAGLHRDVRFGKGQMFSWATKKPGLPLPGELQAMYGTPLHSEQYGMHFEGDLPKGMYGAGRVTNQERGSVIVHSATPDKIVFSTAHTRYPQMYVLLRKGTKPTDWLIKNLTPRSLEEFAGPGVDVSKEHYKSVAPAQIGKLYGTGKTFSEKIDGARMILKLKRDAVEAASYRQSVTGAPIMHTQRLQLPKGLDIPPELVGSTLVGEAFGERMPKEAAYHGSRSAKRLLDKLRAAGKAPMNPDPKPHTGQDASSMLNGSFLARVVQMGKTGSVEGRALMSIIARETAEEGSKILNKLLGRSEKEEQEPSKPILPLLPKKETDKPVATFSAPGSTEGVKVAESAGRVEPQVATMHVEAPKLVPKTLLKPKKEIPEADARKTLNDKVASARARELLRQGDLSSEAVQKLRALGHLPSVGQYTKGLIAGNKGIQKSLGATLESVRVIPESKVKSDLPTDVSTSMGTLRVNKKGKPLWPILGYNKVTNLLSSGQRSVQPTVGAVSTLSPKLKKMFNPVSHQKQMREVMLRHELDELRMQRPMMRKILKGGRIPGLFGAPTQFHSHVHPKVLKSEGEILAGLSPVVAKRFINARNKVTPANRFDFFGSPELEDLRKRFPKLVSGVYKHAQEAIPVQELSGILNSSLAESLRKQRENRVRMRVALFNILTQGKTPVGPDVPYNKKVEMMQDVLKHLPADKFLLPEMATTPEAQKAMFESIQAGKNPRTSEGVVVTPETGVPTKVKLLKEYDVIIRKMFPSYSRKYKDIGIGGFEYSVPGNEAIVGRVGTGLSDELRRDMLMNPEAYLNREARIRAQSQFPSGSYRAPSLITVHEG